MTTPRAQWRKYLRLFEQLCSTTSNEPLYQRLVIKGGEGQSCSAYKNVAASGEAAHALHFRQKQIPYS